MKLRDFALDEAIFIDANIFAYFAVAGSPFQAACTQFLSRVEEEQIQAITSTAVLNEAFYAVLITKAAEELNSTRTAYLRKRLGKDKILSSTCYRTCQDFSQYTQTLMSHGLTILEAGYDLYVAALSLGPIYQLLPTDALHVATCQHYNISHIATADAHFKRISSLQVWPP